MVHFTHQSGQRLAIGDASLYFEVAGNPQAKPLVLLHGGLGSLADFNTIAGLLPEEFRLIAIDFRGHGASTLGTAQLTYRQYQSDVSRILDHLNIQSYALLGFSDGGIVAYRLAAEAPEKVESLITVGAQWKLEENSPVFEMLAGLTPEIWGQMFPESVEYYHSVNPSPNFDSLVQAVVALWTDLTATGYPASGVARITAPTLIVRGDADPLLSLNEAAELQERIEGASFFNVPFAGHEVHKESTRLFVSVINEFLLHPKKLQNEA